MDISKILKSSWAVFDLVLLLAAFVMMAALMLAPEKSSWAGIGGAGGLSERVSGYSLYRPQSSGKVVSVAPVAYERAKSEQIARNMVVSESVQLPVRPALDMRERDKSYEVRFALPQGASESDVNVNVNGNILTLVLEAEQRTFMRRIRIPCDYAHDSAMNHYVSNQVLYVEISTR